MDNFFINPARLSAVKAHVAKLAGIIGKNAMEDDDVSCWSPPDGHASLDWELVNGVAVICVNGSLASAQIPGWFWMCDVTYESLIAAVTEAVNDGEVERILLRMNSPGGTVTGCAEAAAQLDKLAEQKPIWAHCSMADSAAYWLASAANRIIVDPTGEAGSIGVIMTHIDMSGLLDEWGISVTHVFSGDKKADGSPYQPLSKEAKKRFQAEMDYLRGIFVDNVAAYRGMDREALIETQADTYTGQLAVDAGLADEVGFFSDVLEAMAGQTGSAINVQPATAKETSMAKKQTAAKPADEDKKKASTKAEESPAKEDDDEEDDEDKASEEDEGDEDEPAAKPAKGKKGAAPAAVDQKARVAAIIRHPEAQGREDLAQELAFETELTPEAAAKILAKAPKASAAKAENPLDKAMKAQGSPQPGAGGAAPAGENPTISDMARRFKK